MSERVLQFVQRYQHAVLIILVALVLLFVYQIAVHDEELGTPETAAGAAPGAIFTCNATGQYANVDPIVSPGTPSAHEHAFFGANPVHETETSAELRTHATTCVETSNHSGYWMPSVYRNGTRLNPATAKNMRGLST